MKTSSRTLSLRLAVAILVLLAGTTASSTASAQEYCEGGTGGPSVTIQVGQTTFSVGTWGVDATSAYLTNCPSCVDSRGKKALDLTGVYFDPVTGTQFTIADPDGGSDPSYVPRVFFNPPDLLGLYQVYAIADAVSDNGATITFSFDSGDAVGRCLTGPGWFARWISGVLIDGGGESASPGSVRIMVRARNLTGNTLNEALFEAGTPGHPGDPFGWFSDWGQREIEVACSSSDNRCALRLEGLATATVPDAGDIVFITEIDVLEP